MRLRVSSKVALNRLEYLITCGAKIEHNVINSAQVKHQEAADKINIALEDLGASGYDYEFHLTEDKDKWGTARDLLTRNNIAIGKTLIDNINCINQKTGETEERQYYLYHITVDK
jgi:thiamine monophosphate kinase